MFEDIDIEYWLEISTNLKDLKVTEADMRRDICTDLIAETEMKNGIATYKCNIDGYNVVAKQSLSYNIDVPVLGTIWDELSEAERDAVTMKPTLALAKYKALPEDSLLHEAITSKLAMPTLKADPRGV